MRRDDIDQAHAPVLSVRKVHKTFKLHLRGGLELPVLRGVSLDARSGECVALVGPSGRGKSTLMKCLYGSYQIDSGQMRLGGRSRPEINLAGSSAREWIELRRSDIAYVSQFLRAVPRVPALDVVAERQVQAAPRSDNNDVDPLNDAHHRLQWDTAREHARNLLTRLNLPEELWSLPPATFSGGEQQRINIARGFVQPARLLLLDEPTASLDAANRRAVIGLIEEAKRRGSAIVGIFHDEEVRAAVADQCIDFADFAG